MSKKSNPINEKDDSKRDFLVVSTYALAGVGAASFVWPLIDQMNPAADTLALASTEIDLSSLEEGQSITVKWRGKPVFVRHRTPDEIKQAKEVLIDDMRDPQADADRVANEKYIVLVGVYNKILGFRVIVHSHSANYCLLFSYITKKICSFKFLNTNIFFVFFKASFIFLPPASAFE